MNKRFLIAVSGGPDSMALLDQQRNKKNYIEVAHVNYHKRASADRDEKIVKDYCKKYKIKFNKLDYDAKKYKGNFQANARIARYTFFAEICEKHKLDMVLVAHHKDDNIETYLMQVDKKLGVNTYGIGKSSYLYGVYVSRPLLDYTKKDLVKYCDDHNIEYGIDESNLSDCYERNKVRHNIVEKMSDKQKDKLVAKINKENEKLADHFKKAIVYIDGRETFTVKKFLDIPYIKEFLRRFFPGKSDKYFDEMLRQLKNAKSCKYYNNGMYVTKEYDKINFFMFPVDYSYKFNKISDLKTKTYANFKIAKKGLSDQGVTLSSNDFPITIRNAREGDGISMTYGTKKLNRFFIDHKLCLKFRRKWPVVVNKKGEVILVPGLGCDKNHYSQKHNLFVIEL